MRELSIDGRLFNVRCLLVFDKHRRRHPLLDFFIELEMSC